MKILLIDDSNAVYAFVKKALASTEFLLERAPDGQQGLERVKDGKFDLILLDWEMPVLDGPQTLAELRKSNVTVPVIMLTSRNSVEDITRMIEAGANEFVMKPFTPDILIGKIRAVLGMEEVSHAA